MTEITDKSSLSTEMIRGSAWMVFMRWMIRVIGLINTAVLARLLSPEDFGVIAFVMIVVSLVEMFAEVGVDLVLISAHNISRLHYDAAWTIRLITNYIIGLVIYLSAPFAAEYFGDYRIDLIIKVIALKPLISGLENIGIVDFRKELEFSKEFSFNVIARLSSLFLSIALALTLRNYWALAIAMIAQQAISTVLSYIIHPYRPRLSLAAFNEIASFSIWLLIRNLSYTLLNKIDQFVVGKMKGALDLGGYAVIQSISTIMTLEILLPISRALLPGYAIAVYTPARLLPMFSNVTSITTILSIPFGFGLMATADDFIAIVLGQKWESYVPLLQIFAIAGSFNGISTVAGPLMIATGRIKIMALIGWTQCLIMVLVLWRLSMIGNIIYIALASSMLTIVFSFINLYSACAAIGQGIELILATLLRPLISGILMVMAIKTFQPPIGFPIIRLILDVFIGAIIYITVLFILWRLAGKPPGVEHELLKKFTAYIIKK